jgi:hypothetical protein
LRFVTTTISTASRTNAREVSPPLPSSLDTSLELTSLSRVSVQSTGKTLQNKCSAIRATIMC